MMRMGSESTRRASRSSTSSSSRMYGSTDTPFVNLSLISAPSTAMLRSVQIGSNGSRRLFRKLSSTNGIISFWIFLRKRSRSKLGSSRLISPMQSDVSVSPKTRSPTREEMVLAAWRTAWVPCMMGPSIALSLSFLTRRSQEVSSLIAMPVVSLSIGTPSTGPFPRGSSPSAWRTCLPSLESYNRSSISWLRLSSFSCASITAVAAFIVCRPTNWTAGCCTTLFTTLPATPNPVLICPPTTSRAGRVCFSSSSALSLAASAAFAALSIVAFALASASSLLSSSFSRAFARSSSLFSFSPICSLKLFMNVAKKPGPALGGACFLLSSDIDRRCAAEPNTALLFRAILAALAPTTRPC
mmetsp:Transcript_55982/g.131834  ORF Transcript_55982/g.131834 Transcript_55982/m.131834 type:complete len:356 (-) Transcript_55982:199-1266(-)